MGGAEYGVLGAQYAFLSYFLIENLFLCVFIFHLFFFTPHLYFYLFIFRYKNPP
jgi:hypothetical protein